MGRWNEMTRTVWTVLGTACQRTGPAMVERVVEAVEEALHELSPREEQVVRLRFGLGNQVKDVAAIAVRFRLTPAGVLRIEEQALQKLRASAMDFDVVSHHPAKHRGVGASESGRRARLRVRHDGLVTGHGRRRRSAQ